MELARISQLSLFFSYDKLKGKYRRQQYFLCPSPQIAMAKPCDPFSGFYTVPPKKKKKKSLKFREDFWICPWSLYSKKCLAQALTCFFEAGVFIIVNVEKKTYWTGSFGTPSKYNAIRALVTGRLVWWTVSSVPLSCLIILGHKGQHILITRFIFP